MQRQVKGRKRARQRFPPRTAEAEGCFPAGARRCPGGRLLEPGGGGHTRPTITPPKWPPVAPCRPTRGSPPPAGPRDPRPHPCPRPPVQFRAARGPAPRGKRTNQRKGKAGRVVTANGGGAPEGSNRLVGGGRAEGRRGRARERRVQPCPSASPSPSPSPGAPSPAGVSECGGGKST